MVKEIIIVMRKHLAEVKRKQSNCFTYEGKIRTEALEDIAGIINEKGNVLGMMPHPERAVDELFGGADGLKLFQSIVKQWREQHVNNCLNQIQSKLKQKKLYADNGYIR